MSELLDQIMAPILERIEIEADAIGVDMVNDIRQNISTPVIVGELGGITRSPPFEYPWMETGHLRASEDHNVEVVGDVITLFITNDAWYARRLHDGHDDVQPRPFHDLALLDWRPVLSERMHEAILGVR